MSIVERLERGLEFLQAHAWGQTADRQTCETSPDGYSYCAQGAVAYGAFTETGDEPWCEYQARFHVGPCDDDEDGDCFNSRRGPIDREFRDVMEFLNSVVREMVGKTYVGVTWYNDDLYRTKEDIEALFEKAIAKAREDQT